MYVLTAVMDLHTHIRTRRTYGWLYTPIVSVVMATGIYLMILVLVHIPVILSLYQFVYRLMKVYVAETSCAIDFLYYVSREQEQARNLPYK